MHIIEGASLIENFYIQSGFRTLLGLQFFDGFILKILVGHGDRIWNPIFYSAVGIFLFAFSFLILDGILLMVGDQTN
jgi:hypothetical protein